MAYLSTNDVKSSVGDKALAVCRQTIAHASIRIVRSGSAALLGACPVLRTHGLQLLQSQLACVPRVEQIESLQCSLAEFSA